jgi:uncharacterized repeat protein (TIGR01451 family)
MKMKKYILLLLIMINGVSFAQVAYEQKVVIDDSFGMTSPNETAIADVNNDGLKDIIVAGGSKIGWFKSNGAGNFSNCNLVSNTYGSYYNVVAGDLDGDADIDIAFSIWGNNIQQFYWCKNLDGLGTFGSPILIISGGTYMYNKMQIIDVDADNDLDILIATYNYFSIFENTNGTGTFVEHIIAGSHSSASTNILNFAAKNVDTEPKPEIVSVINGTLSCYKINANFTLTLLDAITSNSFSDTYEIGDIDNDGFQDIVTSYSNGTTKKLQYFKNLTGAGSFGIAQNLVSMPSTISTNGNGNDEKRAIEIVDFDNDNKLDIVHIDSNIADANWYKNMGNGVFVKKQLLITTNQNIRDVKSIDANGDGHNDILLIVRGENKLAWYNNATGTGVFGAEILIGRVAYVPNRVDVGDIDNDGDLDLVSSSGGDSKLAWYKNTNGGFTELQNVITHNLVGASNATLGDIDHDGDLDVMAFAQDQNNANLSSILWYENADGLGNFTQQHVVVSTTEGILVIRLVDIDHDGDKDIICASNNNLLSLYKNNGNGTFAAQSIFSTYTLNKYLLDMVVADIDNDGDMDVVVSFNNDEIAWYENSDGQGNLGAKHVIVPNMFYPFSLFVADLDGDTNKEVIFNNRNQNKVGYFKNNGAGVFSAATLIPITGLLHPSIAFAQDVDNDGDQDLFFNNETGSKLSYLLNDGLANFSTPYDVYTSSYNVNYYRNIPNIVSADFNADGKLDFALAEIALNKVAWFKNLGLFQNKITGTIKLDADVNGCTNTDPNVPNVLVTTQNGTNTFATFSQPNGTYELIANQGNFDTSIASPLQNYSTNPVSQTSNFTAIGQTDTVNFCLQPTQLIDDLQVKIYPLQAARPGFNATYRIVVYNNGTNPLSGTVAFTYNNAKFNFVSTTAVIQSQTATSLVFAFDNLIPFQSKNMDIKLQVKTIPSVTIGESVVFDAQLSNLPNDVHLFDNQFVLHQTILGAYDPNDITALEGSEVLIDNADEYLHYIIRFQNTGNSFASRVQVQNILDDQLDFNTIQLETTSHSGKVEITNGNHVTFIFDAIYLPSSSSNFNASQGFICYKIKPKSTVAVGDIIPNTASIYFDYNPAIATNTAQTQFVNLLAIQNNFKNTKDLLLYPNPVKNNLTISTSVTNYTVEIYSQVGQLLYESKDPKTIDFSTYTAGIYFVKISDDEKNCISKKIIKL